jgi:hypothetical protein
MEEGIRYLEKLSGATGHLKEETKGLRVKMDKVKEKEDSIDKVQELRTVTTELRDQIGNMKKSSEYNSKAMEVFERMVGEKEMELVGLGKAGLLKVKWGIVNAKKNNTEIQQEQQKVFQDVGKVEDNNF